MKRLKPDSIIKILHKIGFEEVIRDDEHIIFKNNKEIWVTVPIFCEYLSKALLKEIMYDTHLTEEKLEELL